MGGFGVNFIASFKHTVVTASLCIVCTSRAAGGIAGTIWRSVVTMEK